MLTQRELIDTTVAQMKRDRGPHEPTWLQTAQYALPYRIRMHPTEQNRGDRRNQSIIDSTVGICLRTLKAGMMNGHTNPGDIWFTYGLKDRDLAEFGPVKEWLDQECKETLADFDSSNAYLSLPLAYGDLAAFTNTAMSIEEDLEETFFTRVFQIGTYWVGTDWKNNLGSFYREFRMTADQIYKRFGGEKLDHFSRPLKDAIDNHRWGEWFDVGQIIMPNEWANAGRLESKYKPFKQCWFELGYGSMGGGGKGSKTGYLSAHEYESLYLREDGFDEHPVLFGRWESAEGETWGIDGPGMMSFGDSKSLQFGEKRSYQAIDKLVDPTYVGPSSLIEANQGRMDFLPGDLIVVDEAEGTKGLRPVYEINPRIEEQEGKQEQLRNRLKEVYYYDLFRMLESLEDRPNRTATEILERKSEKLAQLAPTTVQVTKGLLRPMVDRIFKIRWRQGRVAPPPPELLGQEIKIEYQGVFAQAQRAMQVQPVTQLLSIVTPFLEVAPELAKKIDFIQVVDELAHALRVPPKIIRSDEQVQKMIEADQRQAAIARVAELAQMGGKAAKDLSQAKLDDDNALTRMTQTLRGAA